ncbi:hypothetical protein KUTeg_009564 [Tegillarca granosa]|uniref:Uncharacterized protein n=1 Tax=Tegillarca granosa TaxID=220873 RepID=A0ABQ9F7L9_TEGGR|nr:hypothetical protein KUTeg_009564 [Tegillarca granosa]
MALRMLCSNHYTKSIKVFLIKWPEIDHFIDRKNIKSAIIIISMPSFPKVVYDTKDCKCLHSLQDDDTRANNHQLPVTQIQFRHFKQGEKIEYSNILIASYL